MNYGKSYTMLLEPWPQTDTDPVTGLPNFFALVAVLPGVISASEGTIIALSILDAAGHQDLHLAKQQDSEQERHCHGSTARLFAQLICNTISSLNLSGARIFTTGAAEFVVVIPDKKDIAEGFVSELSSQVRNRHSAYTAESRFTWAVELYKNGCPDMPDLLVNLWNTLETKETQLCPKVYSNVPASQHVLAEKARFMISKIHEAAMILRDTMKLAYTDDISQLPNHRAARHVIEKSLERSMENGTPLSLLFIDGDNLRQYNDKLGYAQGNAMIKDLGATLVSRVSHGVLVSRWLSGDEFMIIVPDCPKESAIEIAQNLRCAVQDTTQSWQYPVTVTIGVATYPDDASDMEGLIRIVEETNRQAKTKGKNQVRTVQ